MPGGYASVPLKYIILRGQTMIQDHEPTIVTNNYPTYHRVPPEEAFSRPVMTTEKEPVQYEYTVNFLAGTYDHQHADHVELGETWTVLYNTVELEDGSKQEIRSAVRTALVESVDRLPKTLIAQEVDKAMERGLDKMLNREDGAA